MYIQAVDSHSPSLQSSQLNCLMRLINRIKTFIYEIFAAFKRFLCCEDVYVETRAPVCTIEEVLKAHPKSSDAVGKKLRSTFNALFLREISFYQDHLIPKMKELLKLKDADFSVEASGYEAMKVPPEVGLPLCRDRLIELLKSTPQDEFTILFNMIPNSPLFFSFRSRIEQVSSTKVLASRVEDFRQVHDIVFNTSDASQKTRSDLVHTEKEKWISMVNQVKPDLVRRVNAVIQGESQSLEIELMAYTNSFWSMRVEHLDIEFSKIKEKRWKKRLTEKTTIKEFLETNRAKAFLELFSLEKQKRLEHLFTTLPS